MTKDGLPNWSVVGIHEIQLIAFRIRQGVAKLGLQLLLHEIQPFHGNFGMIGVPSPSEDGFAGSSVGFHSVFPQVTIAGRGNRHLFEWVETCMVFKETFEHQTSFFQ